MNEFRYFRCECNYITRVSIHAIEYKKECYNCKIKFDDIVFDRRINEITKNEFYN